MSEPGGGPGPIGVVGIIANLRIPTQAVRSFQTEGFTSHTSAALLNPWR